MAKGLLTTADIAKLFGTSRQSVNDWIKDGAFPNLDRVGRSYVVPPSDVSLYVKAKADKLKAELAELDRIDAELKKLAQGD